MWKLHFSILFSIALTLINIGESYQNETNGSEYSQRCLVCNSSVDGIMCVENPQEIQSKSCQSECYMHVKDGIVVRGCVGDEFIKESTDCMNRDVCKLCSDKENCNNDKIKAERCMVCDSNENSNCKTNLTNLNAVYCPLAARWMGCYHLINAEQIKRGCMSQLPKSELRKCRGNVGGLCKFCFGENCNRRNSFTKCFNCNSMSDPHCISNNGSIEIKVCRSYKDDCFTFTRGYTVKRGCVNEMPEGFLKECNEEKEKCEKCLSVDDDICNKRSLNDDTCFECDSDIDPRCRDQPEHFREKICSIGSTDSLGCFLNRNGNRIKRGCIQDLIFSYRELCWKQSVNYKSCYGKNCNRKLDYQSCHTCNGHQVNCTQIVDTRHLTTCKDYMDKCLTGLDAQGYIRRGCTTNFGDDSSEMSAGIEVCGGNECNNGIMPAYRLKCYRCGPDDCPEIVSNLTDAHFETAPCDVYSHHDQCFVYSSDGKMIFYLFNFNKWIDHLLSFV